MLTSQRKRAPTFHTGQKFNAIINAIDKGAKVSGHIYVNMDKRVILCQNKVAGSGIESSFTPAGARLNVDYKYGYTIGLGTVEDMEKNEVSFLRLNGVDEKFVRKIKAEESRVADEIAGRDKEREERKKKDELLEKEFDKYRVHPAYGPRPETFMKIIEELVDLKAELEKVKEQLKNNRVFYTGGPVK